MTSHPAMTSLESAPESRSGPSAAASDPEAAGRPANGAPPGGDPAAGERPGSDSDSASDSDSDSGQSGISDISGLNWKPNAGPICWVQEQIGAGVDPREVLEALRPGLRGIPAHIDDITLWKLVIEVLSEPPRRQRLRHINTLADVVRLIRGARNVVVLTGAGVSVSCGIPDFRSRDGIYARLAVDFPDLPDPQAMFDIHYFRRDPRPFFKFAREIYPGQFRPSLCHRFIRMLERQGKLLRNYTQNIDTLEQEAGIENVIQCHGSFATASCQRCRHRVPAEDIRDAIFEQTIPACPICADDGPTAGSVDNDGSSDATTDGSNDGRGAEKRGSGASAAAADGGGEEKRGSGAPAAAADGGGRTGGGGAAPAAAPSEEEDRPGAVDEDTGDSGFGASTRETEDDSARATLSDRRPPAIMKPDIVFFGEGLSDEFHRSMEVDREQCDLLIVIGSSLKVRPVALIPSSVKPEVAQILINREPLPHINCDVQLLGDCDVIVDHLCHLLGGSFSELVREPAADRPLQELSELPPRAAEPPPPADPAHEGDVDALRHCWQRKVKESVAARLPEGTFLHQPPGRYIFPGAEVLVDPDDSDSDDGSSDSEDGSGGEAGPSSEPDPPSCAETTDEPASQADSQSEPDTASTEPATATAATATATATAAAAATATATVAAAAAAAATATTREEANGVTAVRLEAEAEAEARVEVKTAAAARPATGGLKRPLDELPTAGSQKRAATAGAEGEPALTAPAPAPATVCPPAGAATVS